MSHTPGPWHADEWLVRAADGHPIADCQVCEGSGATWEANARLMAAAPDLLVACEAALGTFGDHEFTGPDREALTTLRHALTKARGERP